MRHLGPVILAIRDISKVFREVTAVKDVNLEIQEGEFLTLLGPSGCGKTTTIRIIGGYTEPTGGHVLLDGHDITMQPPQHRNMGMVFQNYALFPHMTVQENVAFPLRIRRWPESRIGARVAEMLDLVRMPGIQQRRPAQLSGGQQQRVALARALSFGPRILLMDEALGALDAKLREEMQIEIKRIQRELNITTIHVTHDQEEALSMSDRVAVMRDGQVAQLDTPKHLYEQPVSTYVADFIGKINLFRANVTAVDGPGCTLELEEGQVQAGSRRVVAARATGVAPGDRVWVGVRPEYMQVNGAAAEQNCAGGVVETVKFVGAHQYLGLRVGAGRTVLALDPKKTELGGGEGVLYASWPPDKTLVLPQ